MGIADVFMDFLFPEHCPACGSFVDERGGWCAACLKKEAHPHRIAMPPALVACAGEAYALGAYRGALKKIIRRLKYQGKRSVLPSAEHFVFYAGRDLRLFADLATAVPLFSEKEKKRGFNQSELLFRKLLSMHQIPLVQLLKRTRDTSPLYGLGREERKRELQGAFSLLGREKELAGRRILLVDDIFTTGATLAECAGILQAAGASLAILVLADAADTGGN